MEKADMELSNPKVIAERGEQIYQQKYKSAYESEHLGKFLAIDVNTEQAYLGDSPLEALESARKGSPRGLFHLIKVGAAGAFRVSYTNDANLDWIFG
jgi:hypothetical protein